MNYKPESEKDMAGVVAMQNESYNYIFGITKNGDDYYLLLERNERPRRSRETNSTIIGSTKIDISNPVRLKIEAEGDKYKFSYSTNGTDFTNLGGTVSGDILSTDVAGGFTGCLLGLYATSANTTKPE